MDRQRRKYLPGSSDAVICRLCDMEIGEYVEAHLRKVHGIDIDGRPVHNTLWYCPMCGQDLDSLGEMHKHFGPEGSDWCWILMAAHCGGRIVEDTP